MKTPSLTFIVAFAAGALLALGIRTARHQPYAAPAQATAPAHEMHAAPTATNTAAVNTICPVCGMEVDPEIPSAHYKGAMVGFGCAECPAEFAADPERYGPAALKNVEAE